MGRFGISRLGATAAVGDGASRYFVRGEGKGGGAFGVLGHGVCPSDEDEFCALCVAICGGMVKGGPAVVVGDIGIGSFAEEVGHEATIAGGCCLHKGGPTVS